MANHQRILAVRRVTDPAESLIATAAEAGDELAAIQEEIADEACLGTAQGERQAVAALRQWLGEAEDNDDDAGE